MMSDTPQGPGWWQASDGKFYPPQSPPPPPSPPTWAPPPAYQQPVQQVVVKQGAGCLKIGLIVGFVLLLLGGGFAACVVFSANNVVNEINKQTGIADEKDYDLIGPGCSVDQFTGPKASGSITNTSKEQQAFEIKVRFTGPNNSLVSEDSTFTDPIDPGQTTNFEVITLKNDAPPDTNCTLVSVSYTIFDNQNDPNRSTTTGG